MTTNPEHYYIEFNTNKLGVLTATRVVLKTEVIVDMDKKMRVDLVDHPLYPKLVKYVLSNLKTDKDGCYKPKL